MKQLLCIAWIALSGLLQAQTINFSAEVTLQYDGHSLDQVLGDLTHRYGIKFSYSRQIVPVDAPVYVDLRDVALADALAELFAGTGVIYGFIGDQIVLSVDPARQWGLMHQYDDDDSLADASEGLNESRSTIPSPTKLPISYTAFTMDVSPRDWAGRNARYVEHERQRRLAHAEHASGGLRFQASLFPPLQARSHPGSDEPVNLSFNLLWGTTPGLQGFELGGFGNYARGDVQGLQIAGAFNGTRGELEGLQVSGFGNYARHYASGLQIGGAGNVAGAGGDLVQVGGAANIAAGAVAGQFAGAVNVADRAAVQVAPVNVAKHVTGLQLGVINVADTVSGTAIGLFTFVRNGYRSFEVAAEETMHANANFRLGVRTFYNIFHIGAHDDHARSWSLGYGIGTSIRSGRSSYVQLELLSRHVNEEETWTDELNLLNSFNLTWDLKLAGPIRLALGPTFNVAVSQRYNPVSETYGMDLPNYTFHERTYHNGGRPVNVKYWVGFHAGLRFSSD
ncbi:MAG: STN domain-containing protein [Saprospiraceae bacterium]|nr:STN domain-containing protein [Saprospiraceae bacterium]